MTARRRAASSPSAASRTALGAVLVLLLAPPPAHLRAQEADVPERDAAEQEDAAPVAAPDVRQETAGVHTVRRGDTLWDLAARFLSDPFRWPLIFEANPVVVEDPHWIYPGERLRIPGAPGVARVDRVNVKRAEDYLANLDGDEVGRYPANSVFRQPRDGGVGLLGLALDEVQPQPVVTGDDVRRAPMLLPPGGLGPEGVTARVMEENPLDLELRASARQFVDVVVVLGALQPAVGDTLKAVRRVRQERGWGDVVVPMALLEVTRLWSDSARATVVRLYGDYAIGDPVVRTTRYALDPAARPDPVEDGPAASLVAFEIPQVLLGTGEAVFLDRGSDDGAAIGDEYAVFSRDEAGALDPGPKDALAILRVVHVTPATSTARVVRVRDPGMRPGDPARLVGRLPASAFGAAPTPDGTGS